MECYSKKDMATKISKIDIFGKFIGREDTLRSITRYDLYSVMLYRTNLFTHSQRVAALVCAMNKSAIATFGTNYDPHKAEILAYVHDDAEIIFGDVQAGNKSKMTPDQLAAVHAAELQAIDEISARYPEKIEDYVYRELLLETVNKDSIEAQLVCFADKYDSMGEAMHEIVAGNYSFATNVVNEYGTIPTPLEYYYSYFLAVFEKLPLLKPLQNTGDIFFTPVEMLPFKDIVKKGRPHTLKSLKIPTGYPHYDNWLTIVTNATNEEVIRDLHIQKESLK